MGKAGKKFIYNGIEFDSPEETYFAMWLDELKDSAFVNGWRRNTDRLQLTPAVCNNYEEKLRKGYKIKSQIILQEWSYTPDFVIDWSKYANGIFYNELGYKIDCPFIAYNSDNPKSIVEVKPSFDRNNMTRLFRHTQKALYDKDKLYVNLVIIERLFDSTFTPASYLKTKTGKDRKISRWTVRTIDNFFNEKSFGHKKSS